MSKAPLHPTEAIFLKEVANHQMGVPHNDGVRRHLRFRQPMSNLFMFEIVTWPGYLCFCGDMGTYVFSTAGLNINDVFDLFRQDPAILPLTEGDTLSIGHIDEWRGRLVSESLFGGGRVCLEDKEFGGEGPADCIVFPIAHPLDYSWNFVWCCYAIVWAIKQYDESAHGSRKDPPTNQGDEHGKEACGSGEEAGAEETSQEVLKP
jgi:hypothetical protein